MTTSRLAPLGAGIAAVALGAALIITTPAAALAATPTEGLQYVSLGDSYAAGYGITPSVATPPSPAEGCLQAQENYPHQIAAALGFVLTDVTCTGAVTANIVNTPEVTPDYFGGGTAALQSAALSAETDVVTVSIGGNDAGFSAIAEACIATSANGPVLGVDSDPSGSAYATCEAAFAAANPPIDLEANVDGPVRDNLRTAYADIRAKAPSAKVFVVGYPAIFPDAANTPAGGCFTPLTGAGGIQSNAVPFTDSDVAFIHGIEVELNRVISEEASRAGFAFIDNQPGSFAHSVCPQDAEPYVNGITFSEEEPFTERGALHPNTAGVAYLAGNSIPVIRAAFPAPPIDEGELPGAGAPQSAPPAAAPAPAAGGARELANTGSEGSILGLGIGGGMLLAGLSAVVVARRRTRRG